MMNKKNDFIEFLEYVTKSDPYNVDAFVTTRTVVGTSFGRESTVRYSYLLGNAYATGYIGDLNFRIFMDAIKGIQFYVNNGDGGFNTVFIHPEWAIHRVIIDIVTLLENGYSDTATPVKE